MSSKIATVKELSKNIDRSKKIGLCSGCFDLLHVGHIKHLQSAKTKCDILVVAVASNDNVNKGPDRPAFDQKLRMEFLESIECVDYVCLNDSPDSIELINMIKPDFYIKGSEYKNKKIDINAKIGHEKNAVEKSGGSLIFTDEIVFSSTNILNKHINKKEKIKIASDFETIASKIDSLKTLNVLLIGDTIIDEYAYCKVVGTSTKHPSLSSMYNRSERMAGGVLAIARHLSDFVNTITLITRVADRSDLDEFKLPDNIETICIEDGIHTNLKKRYISEGYPNSLENVKRKGYNSRLFEVGYFPESKLSEENEQLVISLIHEMSCLDSLMVADFGHGLLTDNIIEAINSLTTIHKSVNCQTNSVNFGFNLIDRYKNIDFVCIDELEARLPFGDKKTNIESIGRDLKEQNSIKNLIITRGHSGQLFLAEDQVVDLHALAKDTIDTVGAGDAAYTMASICSGESFTPEEILVASSIAGAQATQIVGNKTSINKKNFLYMLKDIV